jgi:hypothetical protein
MASRSRAARAIVEDFDAHPHHKLRTPVAEHDGLSADASTQVGMFGKPERFRISTKICRNKPNMQKLNFVHINAGHEASRESHTKNHNTIAQIAS